MKTFKFLIPSFCIALALAVSTGCQPNNPGDADVSTDTDIVTPEADSNVTDVTETPDANVTGEAETPAAE